MEINVKINAQDLANVSRKNLDIFMTALQDFACDETSAPKEPTPATPEPAPVDKEAEKAPQTKQESVAECNDEKPAAKQSKKTSHKTAAPKAEPKREEPAESNPVEDHPTPEVETGAKEEVTDEADANTCNEVDRETVQNRLKEIATSGKANGVKTLLKSYNIKKFSDLPDDKLAEVLEKAEAL